MTWKYIFRIALVGVYAAFWMGGVASYLYLGGPPPEAAWAAPLFLALAAGLLLFFASPRERPVLLLGGLLGFAVEVLGVKTGVPFGSYHYTAVLAPRLFGVPVVLAAAWLILFAYVRQWRPRPLVAAVWMTAIDGVIDPLAAHTLGFWQWEQPGGYYDIPWTNFAGWFLTSLLLFTLIRRPVTPDPGARRLGASVILFFTVIALGTGLRAAGWMGVGLMLLHGALSWRARGEAT